MTKGRPATRYANYHADFISLLSCYISCGKMYSVKIWTKAFLSKNLIFYERNALF